MEASFSSRLCVWLSTLCPVVRPRGLAGWLAGPVCLPTTLTRHHYPSAPDRQQGRNYCFWREERRVGRADGGRVCVCVHEHRRHFNWVALFFIATASLVVPHMLGAQTCRLRICNCFSSPSFLVSNHTYIQLFASAIPTPEVIRIPITVLCMVYVL